MSRLRGNERDAIEQTENTYWNFCKLSQQSLDLYSKCLPHLGACLHQGTGVASNSWNTYYLNYFSFGALYNAMLTGYYPQAGSVLRSILESFVRMRYFERLNDDGVLLNFYQDYPTFCRAHGVRAIFAAEAPGWYADYKFLCGFSHSGLAAIGALQEVRGGGLPDVVRFNERSFRFLADKAVPILHFHVKALGVLMIPNRDIPLPREAFAEVLTALTPFSIGTPYEARINELVPGDLPRRAG
jgi:hypothetical protein